MEGKGEERGRRRSLLRHVTQTQRPVRAHALSLTRTRAPVWGLRGARAQQVTGSARWGCAPRALHAVRTAFPGPKRCARLAGADRRAGHAVVHS